MKQKPKPRLPYFPEFLGIVICLVLGISSGYFANSGNSTWYINLAKPSFSPPAWVFAPVWTVLYVMMGIALGKVWKERDDNPILLLVFVIQFVFNLVWSTLFFRLQQVDLAFYDLLLILANLLLLIVICWYRKKRDIFWLLFPYFIWTCFAGILNYGIYELNY